MRTFFAPAHITGFFEIREHPDLLKTGSKGAGIVLEQGMNTGAVIREAENNSVRVFYDNAPCQCRTSTTVAEEMIHRTCGAYAIEIHHFPQLPVSYGFGISASGALGTAFALNHALDLELEADEIGEIAHIAEVRNSTGLGDVSAELSSGLVIRSREGSPKRGSLKSIPVYERVVVFLIGAPLKTKSVLKNPEKKLVINAAGARCMKAVLKEPTAARFMELSKRFSIETGLMQKDVARAIRGLERAGVTSAMSMLGNAAFTLSDEPEETAKLLDYPCIITKPLERDL